MRGVGLAEERSGNEGGLHAFAGDHEDDEKKYPKPRGAIGTLGNGLEPRADVAAHFFRCAEHVDHHRDDQHRRYQGKEGFPLRRHRDFGEPYAEHDGHEHRRGRAPGDCGQQRDASGFPQVGGGDRDDEKHLDPFAQGDEEDLAHCARRSGSASRSALRADGIRGRYG